MGVTELDGIEAECRAVQASEDDKEKAEIIVNDWWARNFAHKYPDYLYDIVLERIVKR